MPGRMIGHLVLVAYNCGGQNKNKNMIRFSMWIVESSFSKKATLLLLIKGHTKNICNRMFNLAKNNYQKNNIFCTEDLYKILVSHYQLNLQQVLPQNFRYFESWLKEFYVETKETQKFHIFSFGHVGTKLHFQR